MSFNEKRTALITGGSAGLPRGIAIALARGGYDLAFTYRPDGTPPDATLQALQSEGCAAAAYAVDFLQDERRVADSLRAICAKHPIDILVHGVGPMTIKRFERADMSDYHEMVDGNLRSAVQSAAAVLPAMRERRFGRLVFFALNGSAVTQAVRGLALHAAAKAGVVAFARSLALEEGRHGVTVNIVEPGDIRAKERLRMQARALPASNPVGRPGTWEDVADAVLFLVRDDADFLNGVVLNVAGGLAEPYERNAERS